jgi:rare lipoprotein A
VVPFGPLRRDFLAGAMTPSAYISPHWGFRGAGALAILAATLAGCAQPPSQHARRGNEFFSVARYGPASPRVVDDGEPVPRGGGQYLVGHPYTIAGRTYYPSENTHYAAVGMASWYGDAFHGRRTANGEVYDMRSLSAAHPTMPLPSYARVTNLGNGYSMIVRVNDRGPYSPGRIMDVSSRVADMLDFKSAGTAKIKVEYVGAAPLAGTDDSTLVASLRTDGRPATFDGSPASPTMVADAQPQQIQPRQAVAEGEPQPPAAPPRPALAERPRDDAPPFVAAARPKLLRVPPPPARPFDLGAIARVLNTASAAPLPPPRRSLMQASAGERTLYFADRETSALRPLLRGDPFAQVTGGDSR